MAEVVVADGAPPRARTKDFKGPFSFDFLKAKLYFSQSENAQTSKRVEDVDDTASHLIRQLKSYIENRQLKL